MSHGRFPTYILLYPSTILGAKSGTLLVRFVL
uniref:Uncharacterized protein n=1 Tax=Rhizophora mucronata TaxID=61149 RepID=A0A2P2P6D4_RHIMU